MFHVRVGWPLDQVFNQESGSLQVRLHFRGQEENEVRRDWQVPPFFHMQHRRAEMESRQQQTARLNPTARLTIGKRISDRVYLTFSRSLNTIVNDQIVLLEYDESDRVSWILSRNEDSQTYALEFRVRNIF